MPAHKIALAALLAALTLPGLALAQSKPAPGNTPAAPVAADATFGDDSSEWANDGECDDRRFTGAGMAQALSWQNAGRDASDCSGMAGSGAIRLWVMADALAATQCSALDFGGDTGAYPNDGECDDMRFEGLGMASFIGPDEIGKDATDCRRACDMGMIGLRDY